ncbi:MAG: hypothetical protein IKP71_07495 [Candidatus Riflebacteria bacterium]|nr:hypothetical protein [Candidatus Riflebacteria bacterium]
MEKQLSSDRAFDYKKINKSPIGLLDHIRVLSIFLLILIPVLYLYNYFNELAENTGSINEELVKEQLLSEMNRLQENLNPEKHIENAFQDLERNFGIPDLDDNQYRYSYDDKNTPDFLNNGFIGKAKYYLKEIYGLEPFIFISSGYDFTETEIEDKNNIFANEKEKTKFVYTCIANIIFVNNDEDGFNNFAPISNKNKDYFNSSLYKTLEKSGYIF